MKLFNSLVAVVLFLSLIFCIVKLNGNRELVLKLEGEIETKAENITELENIIENQNQELESQNEMIEEKGLIIAYQNEQIEELESEVGKLKSKLDSYKVLTVEATAYTSDCKPITKNGRTFQGCTGITATGVNVKDTIYHEGHRVIAVDPSVIPLHSLVKIDTGKEKFTALAIDTGGLIEGRKIDLLVENDKVAYNFGVQDVKLTILRKGG